MTELEEIKNLIRSEIQLACATLVNKLDETNKKVDQFMNKFEIIEKEVSDVKKELGLLSNQYKKSSEKVSDIEESVQKLQLNLNDLEQYSSRNQNIEINGIPQLPNESLTQILSNIATHIGYSGNLNISKIHRIPTRSEKAIKPIICQFSQRKERDDFLDMARGKKLLKTDELMDSVFVSSNYFVNEHLTPHNKFILYKAKQFRRENQDFQFVWCREVFVRKDEKAKVVRIRTVSDLDKL